MKNVIFITSLVTIVYSCSSVSGKKQPDIDLSASASAIKEDLSVYSKAVSSFFDSTLLHSRYFNGSILVAKDGQIIYENYQGHIDLRKDDPIDVNTPMHVASTSKTLTSTAILKLVQENKLSLDDSLEKFFPGFPYHGISVKMLLDHRSGLPNYLYFINAKKIGKSTPLTNEEVLKQLYSLQPDPAFVPDTHFAYCNTNFVLLALIIERVTGQPFPDFMRQQFFVPLHMNDTYVHSGTDTIQVTPSFYTNGRIWRNDIFDGTYGDKNIYTTPRDLFKWSSALFAGKIINRSLLDSALTPYSFEKPSIHNYGLGWRLAIFPNGKKYIYHYGRWHGFNAAFAYLQDEKTTIIILGNRFTYAIYNAAHKCASIFGSYWQKQRDIEEDSDSSDYSNEQAVSSPDPTSTSALTKNK